ncbi:hypothetical protein PIIN_01325 [Serendipita indica DSM 11827]|uniref:Protein PNS1 n=1 Tax=Serendipita indica (strain DSM 11827) TaxID=1109443 RepID=G4T853_SERID|nr:hypothetical protein PIIN_01325 [Serendipita indica DSM 11827]
MANFSSYASKFLNQSLLPNASTVANEPLFYSIAEASHEGLDDEDVHLRRSGHDNGRDYDPFNLEDIPDDEREQVADLEPSLGDVQDSLPLLLQSNWRQAHSSPQRRPQSPSSESSATSSDGSMPLGLGMFDDDRPQAAPLTQSLLPRNTNAQFTFSLPKPGRIPRRKYNDWGWALFWYTCLAICGVGSILTLFLTSVPTGTSRPILYTTLTHTIPLITLFTIIAAGISYLIIALLRVAVKPVLMGTSIAVPSVMILAAAWAFAGSFYWTGRTGGWAETVGLRLFALVPLVLAGLSARSLYRRRLRLHETISVVTLSTKLLLEPGQLPLLALSPAILLGTVIASLPFLSLAFHLLLIGYFGTGSDSGNWHLKPYAGWLFVGTIFVWIWSWFIARDILRMSVSAVIGCWYFLERRSEPTDELHAAVYRATSPSLGTNCLSALVMAGVHSLTFLIHNLSRLTVPPTLLPFVLPLAGPTTFVSTIMASLSNYALVYVGITGDAFFPAARRAKALTSSRGLRSKAGYTLLTILLLLTAFSMGLLAAMATYLFTTFTLKNPSAAPLASFIGGMVTFLVGWFCMSLIDDVADSLYMCYCIDVDIGATHKPQVFDAFEGRQHPPSNRSRA